MLIKINLNILFDDSAVDKQGTGTMHIYIRKYKYYTPCEYKWDDLCPLLLVKPFKPL